MDLIGNNLQKMLALNCAEALRQGAFLLNKINERLYLESGVVWAHKESESGGTIGGHFRHCLEFVNCLLAGIELGRIDYNQRERDRRVETDREYAIAGFTTAIENLEKLAPQPAGKLLLVKPEDVLTAKGWWCGSSVERELEFLQSHTVHHYALIAFKLRAMNFAVPPEFGVAPSTLRHWKQNSRKNN